MSEKIKQIRISAMLTQPEFAKELGVSYSTVQSWENRNIEPSLKCKRKLVQFCKDNNIDIEI